MFLRQLSFESPPKSLLLPLNEIEQLENLFPNKDYAHVYASYGVPLPLAEWAQDALQMKAIVRYQVIQADMEPHIDLGNQQWKYNYILDAGGDNVKTRWWKNKEVVYEHICEENVWYALNILQTHDVVGVTSPRVSLVVRPLL